jgi:hypothetical protein
MAEAPRDLASGCYSDAEGLRKMTIVVWAGTAVFESSLASRAVPWLELGLVSMVVAVVGGPLVCVEKFVGIVSSD